MKTAKEHFHKRAPKYNHSSNWVSDERLIKLLFELSEAGKDSLALDVATGTGLVAREFRGKVKRVTGLDISPTMAERAKDCMDEIVFAPVEQMPFPDDTFDVCVCRQGLQFADLGPAVAEIHRVLKPGGVVVLCHLCAYGEADRDLTFRIQRLRNPARKNYLMPADIPDALSRQGFRGVESRQYATEESVNKWIDNGAIPRENMEGIRELYRTSDEAFRKMHRLRFENDDIIDEMLLVIAKARK